MPRRLTERELDAYDVLPRAVAQRVRIIRVRVLPPGASGMTLGRFVLVLGDTDHDGTRTLLAHELVHVRQWHELGTVRFLVRYLGGYLRALARHRRHFRAYRAIPLEVEAYERAAAWAAARTAPTDPRV
jgi:hypothetical protein